jgi:hypothetical protein
LEGREEADIDFSVIISLRVGTEDEDGMECSCFSEKRREIGFYFFREDFVRNSHTLF